MNIRSSICSKDSKNLTSLIRQECFCINIYTGSLCDHATQNILEVSVCKSSYIALLFTKPLDLPLQSVQMFIIYLRSQLLHSWRQLKYILSIFPTGTLRLKDLLSNILQLSRAQEEWIVAGANVNVKVEGYITIISSAFRVKCHGNLGIASFLSVIQVGAYILFLRWRNLIRDTPYLFLNRNSPQIVLLNRGKCEARVATWSISINFCTANDKLWNWFTLNVIFHVSTIYDSLTI